MINMLQALKKEVPADYAVCVFDASGPTFRDDIYADYKANRPHARRPARADRAHPRGGAPAGLAVLAIAGVEADDVIGTLAKTAAPRACAW